MTNIVFGTVCVYRKVLCGYWTAAYFCFYCVQTLKGTLGIPLIRFEDAVINMYPFTRVHPYETQEIIINDILKHFREAGFSASFCINILKHMFYFAMFKKIYFMCF